MAKAAAVITWLYAAGFGLPTFYVAKHLETNQRYDDRTFIRRLHAFFLAAVIASAFAAMVWHETKLGAVLALAWLPVEAAFWYGFALPIPWLLGVARPR